MGATLGYNENKANGAEGVRTEEELALSNEEGHIVATRNVPEGSTIKDEFERLKDYSRRKSRGRKMENCTFHMSVNPAGSEMRRIGDKEMLEIIDTTMQKLGYGDVPYRIYRHDDTGRPHYHVVSTRIGQDGKKISDSFEHLRLMKVMNELGARYGFVMGKDDEDIVSESETQENAKGGLSKAEKKKTFVPAFDPLSSESRSDQYRRIWEESEKWSLTTFEQYRSLMRLRFATEVELNGDKLTFTGLNGPDGEKCTPPVTEAAIGISAGQRILDKIASTDMNQKRRQRERLEGLAFAAAKESKSFKGFLRLMERKGVYCVVSRTTDGQPFGLTWLDRATRCAWKGSETQADLKWLLAIAKNKKWKLTPPADKTEKAAPAKEGKEKTEKTLRPERRMGRPVNPALQNTKAGPQRITAATQTRGSSVSADQLKDNLTMSEEERQRLENQPKI